MMDRVAADRAHWTDFPATTDPRWDRVVLTDGSVWLQAEDGSWDQEQPPTAEDETALGLTYRETKGGMELVPSESGPRNQK